MDEVRSQDQNEVQISRLLRDVPAVEAPDNFEAMVRSRIAERRPVERVGRSVFWLAVKFTAPIALLLAFGVFLILSDDDSLNLGMIPPVDAPGVASANLGIQETPVNITAVNNVRQPLPLNRSNELRPTEPASQEKALSPDDTLLFPPGVDPRKATRTNERPSAGRVAPISILAFIGITSACTPSSCQVRAVQPGGVAERSGVRVGDVIEAIDERPIDSTHGFSGEVRVRSLRVRRDGKPLTISLNVR
jgi:membrane-associated protease RseP (regulator of RpoE activity)